MTLLLIAVGVIGGLSPYFPYLNETEEALPIVSPPNSQLADSSLNLRVEKLLGKMTLDQKIGQLAQYSGGVMTGPTGEKLDYDDMIAKGQIGSLFNVVGAKATNRYQHIAVVKPNGTVRRLPRTDALSMDELPPHWQTH